MKQLLFFVFLSIAVPFGVRAQTMVMTPDSAAQGQGFSVTIVGTGTKFAHTLNVSTIAVKLERSGQVYAQSNQNYLSNDSTISSYFALSPNLSTGFYDLYVQVMSDSLRTFNQAAAFHVTSAAAYISSVSPTSAYDSQTVSMTIEGVNTDFPSGSTPTIYFQQNGTTYFTATPDSIYSSTILNASVTVPTPPTGYYDVIVQNNVYSDTGRELFRVLGPPPSAILIPDSGMVNSAFDVSVVGQNTSFAPTQGTSTPYLLNISLKQNGVTYYQVVADTVYTTTHGHAIFSLSDSIQPGTYDAEIYGNSQSGVPYDLFTVFYVVPHHSSIQIASGQGRARPGGTTSLGVSGSGVHFIYHGNQKVNTINVVSGTFSFSGRNITVNNDTSLTVDIPVPQNAPVGIYDLHIVEPGTGQVDTGHGVFSVIGSYIDTGVHMAPDSGVPGQQIVVCLSGSGMPQNIHSMYLQRGTTTIIVTPSLTTPPCFPVGFTIPSNASIGSYDLYLVLDGDGVGDTALVKNAFTVEAPAGVGDSPTFSELIQNLQVSPNPTQSNAAISFMMSTPRHVRLVIYDALGKTMATLCDRLIGSGAQNFAWSVSDKPSGTYFYELTTGGNTTSGRIVVQH